MIKNAFGVRTQSTTSPDTSPTISGSLIYRMEDAPKQITYPLMTMSSEVFLISTHA